MEPESILEEKVFGTDAATPTPEPTPEPSEAAAAPAPADEGVIARVETAIENGVNWIERRSFGRDSADTPMPVTNHTGS